MSKTLVFIRTRGGISQLHNGYATHLFKELRTHIGRPSPNALQSDARPALHTASSQGDPQQDAYITFASPEASTQVRPGRRFLRLWTV